MDVSLIICTHNRANILKDALSSLDHVDVPEEMNMELLVVNNAGTDNTSAVIDEYRANNKRFIVKGLFESKIGKTYALNRAIKDANGEILAFIDDDHIVSKGYLGAIFQSVKEHPSYNLFCGRILPNWDGTEPPWVHDNVKYPIRPFPIPCFDLGEKINEVNPDKGSFIPGAGNLIIRKTVFGNIGLFSEDLGPKGHNLTGGEDIELVNRAIKKGERLLYVPEILQYHQIDKLKLTMTYVVRKAYYRSIAAYQFSNSNQNGHVPLYLFRQAFNRLIRALFTFNEDARRYYLVRLAASIGEIQGRRKSKLYDKS